MITNRGWANQHHRMERRHDDKHVWHDVHWWAQKDPAVALQAGIPIEDCASDDEREHSLARGTHGANTT